MAIEIYCSQCHESIQADDRNAGRMARLPDRCVVSNQPAEGFTLKRKLTWRHPALYLLVLPGLLPCMELSQPGLLSRRGLPTRTSG